MKKLGASLAKSDTQKGSVARQIANRVTALKFRKVTDEMAISFNASNETGKNIAKRVGLHPTTVNKWRAGVLGKSSASRGGMFTGLIK